MSAIREIQRRLWWKSLGRSSRDMKYEPGFNFPSWKAGKPRSSQQIPKRTPSKSVSVTPSPAFYGRKEFREFVQFITGGRFI